jgi:HAD superfamily hydrolase (TIGR01509 family)
MSKEACNLEKYHLFDFDGTLMDSMPRWAEKMLHILDEDGIPYEEGIIPKLATMGDRGVAEYFLTLGVKCGTPEEVMARMDAYALYHYCNTVEPKPGVPDYLRRLKAEGGKLYVLTASPHKMIDPCLRRHGLYELFDGVWTTEDFGLPKSDVRIYSEAAARMVCSVPEAVFYDDNRTALQTAKQAGMQTVGVYDPFSRAHTDAIRQTVDRYVESFEELLAQPL